MRKNKRGDMTPFTMNLPPVRQSALLLPVIWLASKFMVGGRLKIQKVNMEGLKPPYLVLSMHHGFTDYYITPLALRPNRANYVSDMEGFANYGRGLYSRVGGIATRRFVQNPALIRNIRRAALQNGDIVVVFPEARHSNVGTNTLLPPSVGKLAKLLGVPVVVQKLQGSYLSQPIWDEKNPRKAPLYARLEKILSPDEIQRMDAKEITKLVNRHFAYDEYRWQYENRIKIDNPKRAQGLHKMLYLCPACGAEYKMNSRGSRLFCTACGKAWEMDVYGRLSAEKGDTAFAHIPDWYEHQRACVQREVQEGRYSQRAEVNIDALPNEKGFVHLGRGVLEHGPEGFALTFQATGERLVFSAKSMRSLHTEYGYREKGDCVVLSTRGCCYYLYAPGELLAVTKMHFACEALFELGKR